VKAIGPMGVEFVKTTAKAVLPEGTRRWIRSHQQKVQDRRLFQRHLRPTDVFLVGHPKSGNTWLAYMLGIAMQKNFANRRITLGTVQEFLPAFHANDKAIASCDQLPSPRIFRNETPLYPELYPKTIYIMRDPRSVLVSYYHHALHDTGENEWTLDAFVDEMLTYGCIKRLEPELERWDRHVTSWIDRSKQQQVKFVKYEDMKRDRRQVLEEVIEFVGIACNEKEIALAVEEGSFENMRKNEQIYGAEPYSGTKGERGYYMRNGKIDGWKQELTPELAKRIEREFADTMRKVGYL